jgi:hypothetical protein
MTLEKNKVPIALAQGIDTKSDPKQLAAGKMTVLENAVLLKSGEIRKANGYQEYTIVNNSRSIGSLKENIFFLTDDAAYTYSYGINRYASVGRYGNFKIEKFAAVNQNASYPCTAYDRSGNTIMHVWAENDGLGNYTTKYMVMYAKTNTILKPETVLATNATKPQVVTGIGMDYFLIVYEDQSTGFTLKAAAIDKSLWSVQATVTLATGVTNYSQYGFSLIADQVEVNPKTAYICWSCGSLPSAADSRIAVFPATYVGFTAPTSVLLSGLTSRYGSAISFASNDIMFAFNDKLTIKTIVYNSTLTSVVAVSRTVMTAGASQAFSGVVIGDSSVATIKHIFTTTLTSAGALITQQPKIEEAIVTSTGTLTAQRVFLQGGGIGGTTLVFTESNAKKGYLPIKMIQQYDGNATGGYNGVYTLYLIEYFNANVFSSPPNLYVAAKFYDLNATSIYYTASGGHPDYIFFVPGRGTGKAGAFGQAFFGLVQEYAGNSSLCVISKAGQTVMAELANNLHVTGGYLGMFDGVEFAEHNFFQYPLQVYPTNVGAGSVGAGTYYYCAIYVWQDAYGQIHQSGVSNPTSITLAGASQVQLDISTLKLTNKIGDVYIEIYRSNDGLNFYKLAGGIGSLQKNDKTVPTITYIDNTPQANIISRPLLYTVGGELNNFSAPACTYVSVYKRRLIVAPSEDSNSFWYSKDIIPATAGAIGSPVSFAAEFVKSVDERGGPVTATVQLDDKLLIFKANSLSVMVGEGPANNGTQDDFTTPQLVVSDTGCLYGRSVVIMPLGVMFQSPKGFYLCDRSLSVSYLGAAVENYNSIECTSGNLKYDKNEVWFGLDNGTVLVYNYYFSQWSTFAWTTSDITVLQINIMTGADGSQLYNLLASVNSNKINLESTSYRKNVSGYSLKFTTGWLSFADMQGFQRVYKLLILGEYKSPHRLQVEVSYDFIDTVTQTTVIDVPTSTVPYEFRVFLTRQKCTAIKFTIQDLTPTVGTWDEAFALSNLALEIGVKRGLNKLPASKSVG